MSATIEASECNRGAPFETGHQRALMAACFFSAPTRLILLIASDRRWRSHWSKADAPCPSPGTAVNASFAGQLAYLPLSQR